MTIWWLHHDHHNHHYRSLNPFPFWQSHPNDILCYHIELQIHPPKPNLASASPLPPLATPINSSKAPGLCAPPITFINAAAFSIVCRQEGSVQFFIQLCQDPMVSFALLRWKAPPTSLQSLRNIMTSLMSLASLMLQHYPLIGYSISRLS